MCDALSLWQFAEGPGSVCVIGPMWFRTEGHGQKNLRTPVLTGTVHNWVLTSS